MKPHKTLDDIREILSTFQDPKSKKPLLAAGLIEGLSFDKNRLSFALDVSAEDIRLYEPLRHDVEAALRNAFSTLEIFVALTAHRSPKPSPISGASHSSNASEKPLLPPHKKQPTERFHLPHVQNILAVASGKGGVGKSMVCLNLAIALQKKGLRVGVLDLDIYGPSLPLMTGLQGPLQTTNQKKLQPLLFQEMPVMSMGFLVPAASPIIWRGPMIQSGVRQLFMDVEWPALDILLLDLPPGTGDTQLTLAQKAPITGALIVSTPQDLALADAKKGIAMFQKLGVPLWGLVENMASYTCPHCHKDSHPFLEGGAHEAAVQSDIPLLASIPLSAKILQAADHGTPTFLEDDSSLEANVFHNLAHKISKDFLKKTAVQ